MTIIQNFEPCCSFMKLVIGINCSLFAYAYFLRLLTVGICSIQINALIMKLFITESQTE